MQYCVLQVVCVLCRCCGVGHVGLRGTKISVRGICGVVKVSEGCIHSGVV